MPRFPKEHIETNYFHVNTQEINKRATVSNIWTDKIWNKNIDKNDKMLYNKKRESFMLKLYLDNCCYNRPFDDLRQEKINIEANAIEVILGKYTNKEIEIYKSKAIDFEISKIKDKNKKRQVEDLYDAMDLIEIEYTQKIKQRAIELRKYNIKDMDALHLAFAERKNIDYFITTDRLLINASKRANLEIKVTNPIEFIMEVVKWQ